MADISKFTKLTLIFISYFKMHATFNNSALCSLKHEKYLLLLRFSMCKKWHFISEKSCLKSIRHDWEPILNQKFYFHYLALNKTTFFLILSNEAKVGFKCKKVNFKRLLLNDMHSGPQYSFRFQTLLYK